MSFYVVQRIPMKIHPHRFIDTVYFAGNVEPDASDTEPDFLCLLREVADQLN